MTISISTPTLSPLSFPPYIPDPSISLTAIKKADGNINKIVRLLNEDKKMCLALFREALEEKDSITQIQLSQAYDEIEWRKKEPKNSVPTQDEPFDPFFYYPKNFEVLTKIYRDAMKCKLDNESAAETFWEAANQGYLPAFLELTYTMWGNCTKSYGFAVQLRPFVNQGNKVIDYYFGLALKHGSKPGTKLFYEGLYWIHKSDGLSVQFPRENESFDDFCNRFYKKSLYSYYPHEGFQFATEGSPILAPSKEKWDAFIKEKVEGAEIAPKEFYVFPYDPKKLLPMVTSIQAGNCEHFESSSIGTELAYDYERKIRGFWVYSLSLSDFGEDIGTISVRKNTSTDNKYPFEIYKTVKNERIQPVIDLMENIMIRTGSTHSAEDWLHYLKEREYAFRNRPVKSWSCNLREREYATRSY